MKTVIEVKPPKMDSDFYKAKVMEAYTHLAQRNNLKTFLNVIAALCRQAYLKGRNDERNERNA